MGLVAVAGSIGAAAVCDEYKIILYQIQCLLLAVLDIYDLACDLLVADRFNDNILYIHAVLDLYSMCRQIVDKRHDEAFVLIVLGKTKGTKVREPINMVHITAKVTLHLQGT